MNCLECGQPIIEGGLCEKCRQENHAACRQLIQEDFELEARRHEASFYSQLAAWEKQHQITGEN